MGKRIITFCDIHAERDEDVEGATYTISVDGLLRTLDLCDEDAKRLIEPLRTALEEHGGKVDTSRPVRAAQSSPSAPADSKVRMGRTPAGARDRYCLWCPPDSPGYASVSGLQRHLRTAHGIPGELRVAYGTDCPICGGSFEALGGHTIRLHDARVDQAFITARDEGDPHGIVARQINQWRTAVPAGV